MKLYGLLLAGGRARRFGSEKAVAPWGAGVMMDAPLAVLDGVCEQVAVSARAGSQAEARAKAAGLWIVEDLAGDPDGPLAGLRQGLVWAHGQGADWLATAPCDTPTLTVDHYRRLIGTVTSGAPAAVGQSVSGLEPLTALWPVHDALNAVDTALSDGTHPPIRTVLAAIGSVATPLPGYDGLNVNTADDLPPSLR